MVKHDNIYSITLIRKGPSIKYIVLFPTNVDPSPVALCHTSWNPTSPRAKRRYIYIIVTTVYITDHFFINALRD